MNCRGTCKTWVFATVLLLALSLYLIHNRTVNLRETLIIVSRSLSIINDEIDYEDTCLME